MNRRQLELPGDSFDLVGSVVLFNTPPDEVERTVEQFLAIPLRAHLCVIDNSLRPSVLPVLRQPRVSYQFAGKNLGYGRGHNLAIRASAGRARYSLVMNTDIWYEPAAIRRLVEVMDAARDIGLIAPRVNYPDRSLQHLCRLLPTPADLFLRRFLANSSWTKRANSRYELRWWSYDRPANIPFLSGCFMLLRTDLCVSIGGFDERYFLYCEDLDLSRRMHAVARTVFFPEIEIVHAYRRASASTWRGTWCAIQSACRYFNKWGWLQDAERSLVNRRAVAALQDSR